LGPASNWAHLEIVGVGTRNFDGLHKLILEMMGDALLCVAPNRQVCLTDSEISFGNH
jgi:hypothetical protein